MSDDDKAIPEEKSDGEADFSKGVEIDGEMFFPFSSPTEINPCAGQKDDTPCGAGCVCRGGQCYYTLMRLQKKGIKLPDR